MKNIYPGVSLKKPETLPASAYYPPRNRYRADSIIRFLSSNTFGDTITIGITNKDISTTKNNIPDYGVIGLGYQPGNACLVSTFRLKQNKLQEELYKVCLHELGHNEGLPHCTNTTCFMRDAEGGNPTDSETGFCNVWKKKLLQKGWKL